MNNLPVWIAVWSSTNQEYSRVELTTVESAVVWVIITIAAAVLSTMIIRDCK